MLLDGCDGDGVPQVNTAAVCGALVKASSFSPVGTNGFYEIMRASTEPLETVAGQVLMQGQSRHWWGGNSSARVEYGLERYYVSEGTGNPQGKLTVQAAVSKSGRATIKEVFVDGKPYAEAMKQANDGR